MLATCRTGVLSRKQWMYREQHNAPGKLVMQRDSCVRDSRSSEPTKAAVFDDDVQRRTEQGVHRQLARHEQSLHKVGVMPRGMLALLCANEL